MKNNLFYSIVILLSACVFSGCSDDSKDVETMPVPTVIQGKVYGFDLDAIAEQWKNNQTIGITMLKSNSTELVEPYHNVLYKTTVYPVGYFAPVATEDVMNYPQDGSKVDIVAYYPYKDDLQSDLYPINVSDQAQTKAFDFYYANNSKGLSQDNKKAIIELRPVLSKLTIKLVPGDGVTKEYLANPTLEMTGMYTKGDFNILNGTLEASSMTDIQGIILPTLPAEEGIGVSGMLFPVASTQGCIVKITLPKMGRTYTWNMAKLPEMKPATGYVCELDISLEKIEVKTVTESPISDWGDNEGVTGGGSKYAPDFIKTKIKDLPLGDWTAMTSGDVMKVVAYDTWISFAYPKMTMPVETVEDTDGSASCKALHLNFITAGEGASYYKQFVAYRTGKLEPTIYTLSFKARGKGNSKCYIKTGDGLVFVGTVRGAAATPYNGYMQLSLGSNTAAYKEFNLDFDCAYTVKDPYSYAEEKRFDATAKDLENCYIALSPNTAGSTEFYIYDVSFKRKLNN